jgi:hypothetical protein
VEAGASPWINEASLRKIRVQSKGVFGSSIITSETSEVAMTHSVAVLATVLALTSSSWSQDPGISEVPPQTPAAPLVELPAAPTEVTSPAFELVGSNSARANAEAFVESMGWSMGWDDAKSWGVFIGESSLLAADPTGLSLSLDAAVLNAKFQFAEFLGGRTANLALATQAKNPAQRQADIDRMDTLAKQPGGDPVAASVRDLLNSSAPNDPNVSFKSAITKASMTAAQAAIPGMQVAKTFVATSKDALEGTVAVVLVTSPKSRQMADALLGRGPAVSGQAGAPIKSYVNGLSPEAFVYGAGSYARMNERGELCLLGFGMAPIDGSEAEEVQLSTDEATQAATAELRSVAGELVEGNRLISRTAEKKKLLDGSVTAESFRSFSSRVSTVALPLTMPGVVTVATKRFRSEMLGDLVCVVRQWNLSDAKVAACLREAFAKQGGWKGGAGVQPDGQGGAYTPAKPTKPKGVPSGSGGPGDVE